MIRTFNAELLKLRKRPAVWVIAGVWLLLSLVFGYVFPYLAYRFGTGPRASLGSGAIAAALPDRLVGSAVQGFPLFAGALALLLGVLAAGSEYGWGTVKVIHTQGPGRVAVTAGKALALVLVVLAVVVAGFGVDAVAALVVAHVTDHSTGWPDAAELLRGLGGGWLIVSMWSLGGMLLGTVLRGTALATGIGLVWALAVENLVRVFSSIVPGLDRVSDLLPGTNAGALAAALGAPTQDRSGGVPGVTSVVSGAQSVLVVAAYVVVFLLVASWLVRRRDIA